MDAVEIARQLARRFHDDAVAQGQDPSDPLAFALAVASMRGIKAASCAPGSAVLRGTRATLVPEEPIIYYEEAPTSFEQAFLVSHEIGHAELGDALIVSLDEADDPEQLALDFDPARSSEPPRTGFDRVVDYGRRQRREVQMDLFARELLMPRHWLRRLHLDDGDTAETIAGRLRAPYEVVAQQMLDALLLPTPTMEDGAKPPSTEPHDFNGKQKSASTHLGVPFLLEAGPGTGKTATLVERVRFLLAQNVDPRRILVLTFSNKAAGEIIDRIARIDRAAAAAMWVGTFHAFGLDLMRRFSDAFGVSANPRLLDRVDAVALLEDEFARLELSHYKDTYDPSKVIMDLLGGISRAKDEVVDADRYRELAGEMKARVPAGADATAAEKALEVAVVYRLYEDIKSKKGCVDFGDLVMRPVQVLESNSAVRDELRSKYDHVLVDEYQDVNRSSVRLISAITGDGTNLWAVGDARQSIYRFRGASSFNMSRFESHDFAGGKRDHLEINYRSFQEILDTASAFAKGMAVKGHGETLSAERGKGSVRPTLSKVGLQEDQAVAIADAVEALRKSGVAYRDQAVLCTGNDKVAEYAAALERLDVPVLYLGNLFDRTDVKNLLALATLLTDGRATGLLRTACMPEFSMPLEDVMTVMAFAREHEAEPGAWRPDVDSIAGLSEEGRDALRRLAAALDGFDGMANAWEVLARVLLDRSTIAASIARSSAMPDRNSGIAMWVLLNFLRAKTFGSGPPIRRSLDRIRRIVRLFDDRDLRQLPAAAQSLDAVKLMTVHGSKGLEFRAVHFPGINAGAIPRAYRQDGCLPPDGMIEGAHNEPDAEERLSHDAEQECLFYVALTRAKDRLMLYAATRDRGNRRRNPSAFVQRLGEKLDVGDAVLSRALPPDPASEPIGVVVVGPIRLSPASIAQLDKCRRKTLYTDLLEVGGRRVPTPFTRMHDAIRETMKAIVKNDVRDSTRHEALLDEALARQKLDQHGYASDYRALALSMIEALTRSRARRTAQPPAPLVATMGSDEIHMRPDDVLVDNNGRRTLRRINTGKKRSLETEAQAFWWVARQTDPSADVEFVFLADDDTQPGVFDVKQMGKIEEKIGKHLSVVRDGDFPPERSAYTCPNCPAFFVCGPLPKGTLKKDAMRFPV
jgi:superfamily I DNA/RNA helicase